MRTEVVTGTAATLQAKRFQRLLSQAGNLIPSGFWRFCGASKYPVPILIKADLCRTRRLKTPINFFHVNMGSSDLVTLESFRMP